VVTEVPVWRAAGTARIFQCGTALSAAGHLELWWWRQNLKSGALITANQAGEQGRQVFCRAGDGQIQFCQRDEQIDQGWRKIDRRY